MTDRQMISRPVEPGQPVAWWQLGGTSQERYDTPDMPMKGEMDPFFFVTKHKNFIPHEYPCRTQFAAERRGKRPAPTSHFVHVRNWLPFGAPRVDLSGFWFRPTVLSTWARTFLTTQAAGKARLRLATCGGAVLFVNGAEAGWMAPYSRNLEAEAFFDVELKAGANEIELFFDDLAERDARYYFQMDYIEGPAVSAEIPAGASAKVAEAIIAALSTMRFEEPAYTQGEVALIFAEPVSTRVYVGVGIEGDFMSTEHFTLETEIPAGKTRLALGDTAELPGDFRHFGVTLSAEGFDASRVFGVELCDVAGQGEPPAGLDARIGEALDWISANSEADTVRAIARLSTGRGGEETEAMIAAMLPAIEDCHDCADFILVPLLWSRIRFAGQLSPEILAKIDHAILNYRYWMDEPGNDVQWYFSENHALLFHTACYLAGNLLPDATFVRSGRKGAEQSATGARRVRAWLDHFEHWEMAEFNSAPYFPIDLKGLTALYALSPDADIRERAAKAIQRLLLIVARSAHHGILTAAQGRSYEHTLRAGRTLELSGIARVLWGKGNFGRRYHCLPQLALCIRDHGLKVPAGLAGMASVAPGHGHEWMFAQGQDHFARLYHWKNAAAAMGSAAHYRWDQWGYQETVLHLRLGRNPDAQIWINQPGELIHSGYARPSYWGGSATLPRVQQYKGLAVAVFKGHKGQPELTHAWFPQSAFDKVARGADWAAAQGGEGLAFVKGGAELALVGEGPTAGNELRQTGLHGVWIARVGDTSAHGGLDGFARRFAALAVRHDGDTIVVEDPDYGAVRFKGDGSVEAEGRLLQPSHWTVEGYHASFAEGSTAA